ncbi:MAG: isoprenylcysteine carboxylmethyltransferase family protein [Gemmatimonadota bacterium]|nr:isoprenylcysteine carboxylmethyltransferase family protein [Gemmatimonadota bacterium]
MNLNRLRLKAVWLLVVPFLVFARPTPGLLVVGAAVAAVGLAIRAWAAGTIHKERELTITGPYAFTRNPLYVGSFFIGLGVTVAGGHWIWPALFVVFYVGVYAKTMAVEAARLTELFGERYRAYARRVPAFLPRITPYRPEDERGRGSGFRMDQYIRHREWEALAGGLAAFAFLALKAWWITG